jgi:hypothetical protein
MNTNFSSYTVADWLKLVANVSAAAGAGYAQGGYVGLAVTSIVALAALLQTPPATVIAPAPVAQK